MPSEDSLPLVYSVLKAKGIDATTRHKGDIAMSRPAAVLTLLSLLVLSATAQQQQLRIVASSPQGVISAINQSDVISVTFSEPMVALQAVPKDEGSGPMIIEPAVKGKYRWMGTGTLTFIPDQRLPYSSRFTVVVPGGTSSVTGLRLPGEFRWVFETPRPKVTWTSPAQKDSHADTATSILLRFNQPVDPGFV